MWRASIVHQSTVWAELTSTRVRATGGLLPRLALSLTARTPVDDVQVDFPAFVASLRIGDEVAGTGTAVGLAADRRGADWEIQVPIPARFVERVEEVADDGDVLLKLDLRGTMRVRDSRTEPATFVTGIASDGEWRTVPFAIEGSSGLTFQIPRSTWYEQVRQPLDSVSYLLVPLALPGAGSQLATSTHHLRDAERSYSTGDYSGTFQHCRLAFESLPGHPKNIFDTVTHDKEREYLNKLTAAAGAYLHLGRHTSDEQPISVDRADALFALNQSRMLLAHIARVLVGRDAERGEPR